MMAFKAILLLNILIACCLLHCACAEECKSKLSTLRLLILLPATSNNYIVMETEVSKTLDLTVDQINNSSGVLPCHKLELIYKYDGCERDDTSAITVTNLVSGLFPKDGSKVVGIVGPSCSESARKVVLLTDKPEIKLIVIHSGGQLILENSKNFVSILGSAGVLLDLSFALIQKSGWQSICLLYEGNNVYFHRLKEEFLTGLSKSVAVSFVSAIFPFFNPLYEIRSTGVRIVFIFASPESIGTTLCLAYRMGLIYPAYQWVILNQDSISFVDNYSKNFKNFQLGCTIKNFDRALHLSFQMNLCISTKSDNLHLPTNVEENMKHNASNANNNFAYTALHYTYYDALWAWTLVLHNLTTTHNDVAFGYGNASLANIILSQLFNMKFEGATGPISFNSSSAFTNRNANLYQINNGKTILIGSSNSSFVNISEPFIRVSDRVKFVNLPDEIVVSLFVIIQCIQLIVVVVLHVITIVYRKAKTVKASSPKLTHLTFIGLYVFNATLMLNCVSWLVDYGPDIDATLCQVIWAWGLPLSFTLPIGIVTTRTWRLYRIFVHYLNPGKCISNPALTAAVVMLMCADIVIATLWTSVDPMKFMYIEITVQNVNETEVLLEPECHFSIVWAVLIFSHKIVLLLTLIVLTVLTRHILNSKFSTKSIQLFTYTFTSALVLGFTLYYMFVFIRHDPYSEFITLSSVLNILFALIVIFIIIPPLVPIFHRKR